MTKALIGEEYLPVKKNTHRPARLPVSLNLRETSFPFSHSFQFSHFVSPFLTLLPHCDTSATCCIFVPKLLLWKLLPLTLTLLIFGHLMFVNDLISGILWNHFYVFCSSLSFTFRYSHKCLCQAILQGISCIKYWGFSDLHTFAMLTFPH